MAIDADNLTLAKTIFHDECRVNIPDYQRPFSWTTEQLEPFWTNLLAKKVVVGHFAGVLLRTKSQDGSYEIVDGQQRVTATTILMCIIRDVYKKINIKQFHTTHRDIVQLDELGEELEYYRLTVGREAKDYFVKTIQQEKPEDKEPKTEEEKRLSAAHKFFKARVDEYQKDNEGNKLSKEERVIELSKLRKKLRDLNLVVVTVDGNDIDSKFDIFQSLNSTGLNLSQADLIKNSIMKNCKEEERPSISASFAEISATAEDTPYSLTNIIRYYFIGTYKQVTEKKLHTEIEKKLKSPPEGIEKDQYAKEILKEIEEAVNGVLHLTTASHAELKANFRNQTHGEKFSQSVQLLRELGVKQHLTLLLAIHTVFNSLPSESDVAKLVNMVANFSIAHFGLLSLPGNQVEQLYATRSRNIRTAANYDNVNKRKRECQKKFNDAMKKIKDKWPKPRQIKEGLDELHYEPNKKNRGILRAIFGALQFKDPNQDMAILWNDINIEHVFPQKPRDGNGVPSSIKPLIHSIGNLCLVNKTINKIMSNTGPLEKADKLKGSSFKHTIAVGEKIIQVGKFTKPEISDRRTRLNEELQHILKNPTI